MEGGEGGGRESEREKGGGGIVQQGIYMYVSYAGQCITVLP